MVKQKESRLRNTKIAIIFFVFLAFIVGVSLLIKLVLVIREGQFDDSRRFTLSVSNSTNNEVISLSPSTKSIAVFKLDKDIGPARSGQFLEVPIDGYLGSASLDLNQKIDSLFLNAALNYKNLQTNLTIIDLLKLLLFSRTVSQSAISTKNIPQDLSTTELDKIVGRLVNDELIEKDNQTIQIINGTDINGLGNRLARLVTNMGGDVIIVATENSPKKESIISYIDQKTYTVERLQKVLGYSAVRQTSNAISDITIIIGEDKVSSPPF